MAFIFENLKEILNNILTKLSLGFFTQDPVNFKDIDEDLQEEENLLSSSDDLDFSKLTMSSFNISVQDPENLEDMNNDLIEEYLLLESDDLDSSLLTMLSSDISIQNPEKYEYVNENLQEKEEYLLLDDPRSSTPERVILLSCSHFICQDCLSRLTFLEDLEVYAE